MADKKTHFGRAGEYYGMSELLLRGWNVAVPVVDVGDDVFVIDDNDKTTWRLQVKSAEAEPSAVDDAGVSARFKLSRTQLRSLQRIELFYMLLVRVDASWRFLVIPRPSLLEIRDAYVAGGADRQGPGRRPLSDDTATTDGIPLEVVLRGDNATAWGASLSPYLDLWPEALPAVTGGPGTIGKTKPTTSEATAVSAPAPSPRREK